MAMAGNVVSLTPGGPNLGTAGQFVSGPGDAIEPAFVGIVTLTGDGTSAITANYIDGTNAIPFTPAFVRVSKVGGNDTNNGIPVLNTSTALNNVAVSVVTSAAVTSAKTYSLMVELFK